MITKVKIIIFLFFGFAFLMYLFPVIFVEGAKLESGVTIKAPSTTPPPAGTCTDSNGDGINDATLQPCGSTTGPAGGTCGLQIVSGVPINYGQLTLGQTSAEKQVMIKNEGTSLAKVMLKGDDWKIDEAGNPSVSGPEATHATIMQPNVEYSQKATLTNTGKEFAAIQGGQSIPFYFQFKVPATAPTDFSGSLHQEVTMDLLC